MDNQVQGSEIMEHKWAMQICKKLLKEGVISSEQEEIYIYGFELILSFLTCTAIILIIGIILEQLINTLIFLFLFILIRRCTGGFHAKTHLQCQLYTICFYLTVILLSIHTAVPLWSYVLLAIAGGTIILWLGPIENPNKTLTLLEKQKNKWIGFVLFEFAIGCGCWLGHLQFLVSNIIFYTLTLIIILMIVPKLKERRTYI